MILEHYSDKIVAKVHTVEQPERPFDMMKPLGLWVSVKGEDDWPTWCQSENFRLGQLRYRHRVRLWGGDIKYIRNVAEFDKLCAEYNKPIAGMESHFPRFGQMQWQNLAADYDGLIITPYLWDRRLDGPLFYYGWDCASGCIWNARAIQSIEMVEEKDYEANRDQQAA